MPLISSSKAQRNEREFCQNIQRSNRILVLLEGEDFPGAQHNLMPFTYYTQSIFSEQKKAIVLE